MSDNHPEMQLVGRSAELERLSVALENAIQHQGSVCLLTGEPGIGKSRLCRELAARAADRCGVSWGACWESGGAPAYWPWIQILRALLRQWDDARTESLLGTRAVWLAQLLPELRRRFADCEEPPRLEPSEARFQLLDAVSGLLCDAAADAPMLIFLEDLHAADTSSVLLLDFMARAARGSGLLLVGTYREAEASSGALAPLLGELSRHSDTLPLQRLDEAALGELLDAELGRGTPPETLRKAFRISEGNPLFAGEVLRLLQADCELGGGMPEGARGAIRARLARLPQGTIEILEAASVFGRDFERSRLARVVGCSAAELHEALAGAQGAHVLDPVGGDSQRFSHGLIRDVLYSDLDSARREALHGAVAGDLRAHSPLAESISEVAHHLLHAGDSHREAARDALVESARAAEARFAFDDAARAYEHARDLCTSMADEAFALELALGRAQLLSGATSASRATCEATLARAQRSGTPRWVARAALACGAALVFGAVDSELIGTLELALHALDDSDVVLRAEVMARLAAAMQPARDPRVPVEMAKQAVALVRPTDDLSARLRVLDHGCSSMMDLIPAKERQPFNREFTELAEQLGTPVAALRGYQRLLFDAAEQGQSAQVQHNLARASELAELLTHPHYRWPVAALSAMVALFHGDFGAVEVHRRDFLRLSSRTHDLNAQVAYALQDLELTRVCGFRSLDEWQRLAAQIHATSPLMREFRKVIELEGVVRSGQLEEAGRLLEQIDVALLLDTCDPSALLPLAFAVECLGKRDFAKPMLELLEPRKADFVSWGAVGMVWGPPISLLTGWLRQSLGEHDAATADFKQALATLEACAGHAWIPMVEAALDGEASTRAPSKRLGPSRPTLGHGFSLEPRGEGWSVECAGRAYQLKSTKGIELLAKLVAQPGREFHCLDLSGTPRELQAGLQVNDTLIDDTARQQYKQRYQEVQADLDAAEQMNDTGRIEHLRSELDALREELARGMGLGGRLRKTHGAAERARVNVQRRLKDAINRISKLDAELGKHLEWAVRTGTFCTYDPS